MQNFERFENEAYQSASSDVNRLPSKVKIFLLMPLKLMKIFGLLILEIFEIIFKKIFAENKKDISNQVVLITGGANGLGRALACRFAQEKCKIAIADINYEDAKKTAEFISETYGIPAKEFKVDVSEYDEIQKLKKEIEKTLGSVDILVNNAGIVPLISLREGKPQDIQKILNVNLTSHFWTVRTFLDGMIQRKRGHIVAISSVLGKTTMGCTVAYCATKHGITGFMNALYDELCVFNEDEYVKLTTAFPLFITTRREIGEILNNVDDMLTKMTPEYCADKIVDAILTNTREINLPPGSQILSGLNLFPMKTLKYARTTFLDMSYFHNLVKKQRSISRGEDDGVVLMD